MRRRLAASSGPQLARRRGEQGVVTGRKPGVRLGVGTEGVIPFAGHAAVLTKRHRGWMAGTKWPRGPDGR